MKNVIVYLIFIFHSMSSGEVKRIDEKEIDLSKPFQIFMTSGRSTILEFPCEINHAVLGLEEEIKLKTGPDNKKTITLWLMNPQVQPTNLTVKCDEEYYVFDIIPNNHTHQDFINIVDSFDSRSDKNLKLVAESGNKKSSALKSSEFEVKEKDIIREIENSQQSISFGKKETLDDSVLRQLNKNSRPRRYLKTISSKEFIDEIQKSSKKAGF